MFMLDYLYNLFSSFNPTYARICQEDHEDGSPHLHCLVQTDKKFCITNERHFDVSDPNRSGIYHPNCQIPRRDADVADYIAKGGRFEERGILRASRRSPKKSRDSLWTAILNESTSKSEFLARCVHDQPYTAVTQYRNLEYFANTKWPEPITVYEPKWTTFPHVPEPIKQWAEDNLFVVSVHSMQLIAAHLEQNDIKWASELTAQFINDEHEAHTDRPIIINDAGPGTETGQVCHINN